MRILYLDCFSGISGDMTLGALVDAGLPFDELKRALGSLALPGYEISVARVLRAGISATQFIVTGATITPRASGSETRRLRREARPRASHAGRNHLAHRPFGAVAWGRERAKRSSAAWRTQERSTRCVDRVHRTRSGALDSIIDVVGACLPSTGSGPPALSPRPERGRAPSDRRGQLPVPAPTTVRLPATRRLWGLAPAELVTPPGVDRVVLCHGVRAGSPMTVGGWAAAPAAGTCHRRPTCGCWWAAPRPGEPAR